MKTCRLCTLPIVEGEDVIHDPLAYWAHHVDIHVVCGENPDQALAWARGATGVPNADQADACLADSDPDPEVRSRAMPRMRQLKVSRDRL